MRLTARLQRDCNTRAKNAARAEELLGGECPPEEAQGEHRVGYGELGVVDEVVIREDHGDLMFREFFSRPFDRTPAEGFDVVRSEQRIEDGDLSTAMFQLL